MSLRYLKLQISPTIKSSSSIPTSTSTPSSSLLTLGRRYLRLYSYSYQKPKSYPWSPPHPTHILIQGRAKSHQFYLQNVSQIWYYSWHYFYTSTFRLDYCDGTREFKLNTCVWIQPQLWSHRLSMSVSDWWRRLSLNIFQSMLLQGFSLIRMSYNCFSDG